MALFASASAVPDRKRRRDEDDDLERESEPLDKRARPTLGPAFDSSDQLWQPQDILSSPSRSFHSQQNKYDSDDQSSMVSEPGSPQPLSPAGDEDIDMMNSDSDSADIAQFSQAAQSSPTFDPSSMPTPWKTRTQTNRVATPIMLPCPGTRPLQTQMHMRQRHPQENLSSDRLEVPSPIDEDEVPTPPSAAEAAGSQLELLTVSDVDMESGDALPRIAVQNERSLQVDRSNAGTPDYEPMESATPEGIFVRKQRVRSGAVSAGNSSPMRATLLPNEVSGPGNKRGISMGYRHDCEKCRLRVPGHMNHFF